MGSILCDVRSLRVFHLVVEKGLTQNVVSSVDGTTQIQVFVWSSDTLAAQSQTSTSLFVQSFEA